MCCLPALGLALVSPPGRLVHDTLLPGDCCVHEAEASCHVLLGPCFESVGVDAFVVAPVAVPALTWLQLRRGLVYQRTV